MLKITKKTGSILIFSLWTLAFLTTFAVRIGLQIRQRVELLGRIESRSKIRLVAASGVKKSISALRSDIQKNKGVYTSYGKLFRHNNDELYKDQILDGAIFNVNYPMYDGHSLQPFFRYGFIDEESKININAADYKTLKRLYMHVIDFNEDAASNFAVAIINWRQVGSVQISGFYSDDYYSNLDYPYETKDAFFEVIDEVSLISGITPEIFEKLKSFVTVYGDGRVNVNTASKEVLIAVGFDIITAEKLLAVRRGYDELEATVDDYIFKKAYDIVSEMIKFIELEKAEASLIDAINKSGRLKTNSEFYWINSEANLNNSSTKKLKIEVSCVYNSGTNEIKYWNEK